METQILDERIKIKKVKVLSNNWGLLNEISFQYRRKDGKLEKQNRESYDTGDGATILLYNKKSGKVILTRQFRLPTYLNGNKGGMLIETCAGLLDKSSPRQCAIQEAEEETGYRISEPKKIFEAYMSPGSVTEIMHFFVAEYSEDMKVSDGGGLEEEQEEIEVLEIDFEDAYTRIYTGEINDAKTIMLLQYAKLHSIMVD